MTVSKKTKELIVFLSLNLMLLWPAWIAASAIKIPQSPLDTALNPSPHGYIISLVLFCIPCLLLGATLCVPRLSRVFFTASVVQSLHAPNRVKAFIYTFVPLTLLGVILDIMCGSTFFKFTPSSGVLGIRLWAFFPSGWGPQAPPVKGYWHPYIPVEELGFYSLGFLAILLVYIWSENVLFRHDKVDMEQTVPPRIFDGRKRVIWFLLVLGLVVSLAAYLFSQILHEERGNVRAWPGYFWFLLWTAILPSMLFFHISFHFINWRALTVTWLFILTISQFWEGTLGVPYQWWGYNPDRMIGLCIKPQCNLPIEAVLVWSLCSWTTVVVYEYILAFLNWPPPDGGHGRRILHGPRGPIAPHLQQLKHTYQTQLR